MKTGRAFWRSFSYARRVSLGFALLILLGAGLLMLPAATAPGQITRFSDALFTAASATCVTGLVTVDTATHWTVFGQAVILLLIQIGGLGIMAVGALFALALRRRIGLSERTYLQENAGAIQLGGAVRLVKRVLQMTLVLEGVSAAVFACRFVPDLGWGEGIFTAVFHAVSSFCNAGFDRLGGRFGPFCSLAPYRGDVLINLVTVFLIVSGGVGFVVWQDLFHHRWHWQRYHLHTKIVLSVSLALILLPALFFWAVESGGAYAELSPAQAGMAALFQSVSYRTAGFSTVDSTALSPASRLIGMVLMLIGGSPGSTAGGMKTTTVFVILLSLWAVVRRRRTLSSFRRRLDDETLRRASAIGLVYLLLATAGAVALCCAQPLGAEEALYEVTSAVGTVGVSLGVTPGLSLFGKLMIAALMYFGRVGALSILSALSGEGRAAPVDYPCERITVG